MTKMFALAIVVLITTCCNAQWYAAPVVGYQLDVNKSKFRQINTALQVSYKTGRYHELIFQLQRSWPGSTTSTDSAFSQNPALPLYTVANKTIRPEAVSLSVGHRFKVAGIKTSNIFSMLLFTGVKYEKISVQYDYNKAAYTILNPDRTLKRTNIFFGFGAEYMHNFKKGRVFVQFIFATPPLGNKLDYPSSFKFITPVSFSVGYSIPLNTSKNDKK